MGAVAAPTSLPACGCSLSGPRRAGEGWSATLALTRGQALELIGAEGGAREISCCCVLERRLCLVAGRRRRPVPGRHVVQVAADLLDLDPSRLFNRKAADAGAEGN